MELIVVRSESVEICRSEKVASLILFLGTAIHGRAALLPKFMLGASAGRLVRALLDR